MQDVTPSIADSLKNPTGGKPINYKLILRWVSLQLSQRSLVQWQRFYKILILLGQLINLVDMVPPASCKIDTSL